MNSVALFEKWKVRREYDEKTETWWFSVVDIVQVLTESENPRRYWSDLTRKLVREGSEVYEKIVRLKMPSSDGKQRLTDVADPETLLRLVQSIPSPKAEPFKLWLARVGYERIQEMAEPEIALNRSRELWKQHGRSDKWIERRMQGQETRNKLTDYWKEHEVAEGREYAMLTDIIHKEWTGLRVKEHKELKGLKKQNLRDHMSEAELIFTALAELSTRQIAETTEATGFTENAQAGRKGGRIAKVARESLEQTTGQSVVTGTNFLPPAKDEQ